jgi:hypothetical protein
MTGFGSATLEIYAIDHPICESSMPDQDANDVMRPRLQGWASTVARAEGALRDTLEGDDRQMLSPGPMLDAQFHHHAVYGASETMMRKQRGFEALK